MLTEGQTDSLLYIERLHLLYVLMTEYNIFIINHAFLYSLAHTHLGSRQSLVPAELQLCAVRTVVPTS